MKLKLANFLEYNMGANIDYLVFTVVFWIQCCKHDTNEINF